jgi:HSP20 family protein
MMSILLAGRRPRWQPDLSEWFTDFPTWADLPLIVDTQLMRLEDEMQDGRYVVRAEIPGYRSGQRHRHHRA